MAKYNKLCNEILDNIGGKDNVSGALHCMTRLRLNVKDRSKINLEKIKEMDGVLGAQFSGEQFQVIIGQHVSQVYSEFCSISGVGMAAGLDENLDKEPFNIKKVPSKILDYVSGSISSILPIMISAGFFKMIYAILGPSLLNVMSTDSQFMKIIYIVGEAGMYFMPIYVAWGAAKKLNTSIPMALTLGTLLIDPKILEIVTAGESFKIYGIFPMQLNNYTQTILPILFSVWILSYIYKYFDRIMPNSIKVIAVPFCTVVVMVPIMFCALAPIGNWVGMGLSFVIETLYNVAGPLAIALIAAIWPFVVATGMHGAIVQIALINIATLGYDPIVLAGSNIANYALMGMVVAYFFRVKGKEKQMAGANVVTLLVGGISEPTLFSILLRNKKAMLCQIIGGAIGGFIGGTLGVKVYVFATSNILTVLAYAGPGNNFIYACIAAISAFVSSLLVGLIIGFGSSDNLETSKSYKKKETLKV
jgi:beta-glucoside PTS system EIICBA component